MKRLSRCLWLALVILVGLGVARLKFSADVLEVLPAGNPAVQGLQLHQRFFANARELFIVVQAADGAAGEAAARSLAGELRSQSNLCESVFWQPPWQESPGDMAALLAHAWRNQPPEVFAQLPARLAPAAVQQALAEAKERLATSLSPQDLAMAGYDPLDLASILRTPGADAAGGLMGGEAFGSADGTLRMISVKARGNLAGYRECVQWMSAMRQVVAQWQDRAKPAGVVSVRYTGRPAFMAEIGGGMETDLAGPSAGTLLVIALLFYFTHRRWLPMIWLIVLLLAILAGTLALGGLILSSINVVSLGFAAVLLGLAEDFGIVLYQESRAHPNLGLAEIQRHGRPGIWWSALTTASAFLLLNFSGVPGLGQLGTLVAVGIFLSALLMLYAYLPPLRRWSGRKGDRPEAAALRPGGWPKSVARTATVVLAVGAAWIAFAAMPRFNQSAEALRPKHSEAYAALDDLKRALGQAQEPLWVVVQGRSPAEVAAQGKLVLAQLAGLASNQVVAGYSLPLALLPQPENQARNRTNALPAPDTIRQLALDHGFTTNAVALTVEVLRQLALAENGPMESRPAARWILDQFVAGQGTNCLLLGVVRPAAGAGQVAAHWQGLPPSVYLCSWELLGTTVAQAVMARLKWLLLAVGAVVLLSLWLALRSGRLVILSLLTMVAALVLLLAWMKVAGWEWNLMNLMALPLLLGMGVDFSLHMLLALQRYQGDRSRAHAVVGRALLLAGATTVAGFASLCFSSNAGLASLGGVCAVGIVCCQLTAVYLLPHWWHWACRRG